MMDGAARRSIGGASRLLCLLLLLLSVASVASAQSSDLADELTQLNSLLLELQSKVTLLKANYAIQGTKLSNLQQTLTTLTAELESYKKQIAELSSLLASSRNRSQNLLTQLDQARELSTSLNAELRTLSDAFDEYRKATRREILNSRVSGVAGWIAAAVFFALYVFK